MLTIIRWERGSTIISFFASYTGWILVRHRWHCLRFLRVLSLVSVFVSVAVVEQKNVRTSWLKLNLEHSSVSQNNQGFFYWFNSRLNSSSMIGAASGLGIIEWYFGIAREMPRLIGLLMMHIAAYAVLHRRMLRAASFPVFQSHGRSLFLQLLDSMNLCFPGNHLR